MVQKNVDSKPESSINSLCLSSYITPISFFVNLKQPLDDDYYRNFSSVNYRSSIFCCAAHLSDSSFISETIVKIENLNNELY